LASCTQKFPFEVVLMKQLTVRSGIESPGKKRGITREKSRRVTKVVVLALLPSSGSERRFETSQQRLDE
jgi:hypothetical protein